MGPSWDTWPWCGQGCVGPWPSLSYPHPGVHTGNLEGEEGAAERALEDAFLRRFLHGTFPGMLADEVVVKRRANLLVLCILLTRTLAPAKLHFLVGYTETLLSHFYKCPVRLELQTLPAKVAYKYL